MLATKCGLAHPRMKSECNTPFHFNLFKSRLRFECWNSNMVKKFIWLGFHPFSKHWSLHSLGGPWKIERKNPWKNFKKIGKKEFKQYLAMSLLWKKIQRIKFCFKTSWDKAFQWIWNWIQEGPGRKLVRKLPKRQIQDYKLSIIHVVV